jgi:hypothetical protein
MNNQVKEFFNKLKRDTRNKFKHSQRRGRRTAGYRPMINFDVADINNFTHFIECNISPTICPMQWEDLDIDFNDKNKRHCEYCDKFVYKADNKIMIEKLLSENKCMAVSNHIIDDLNGVMSEQKYENLQNRLKISMFFLVVKKYEPVAFEEFQKEKLTQEELLKKCILFIFDTNNIKYAIKKYIDKGADMQFILETIVPKIDDESFQETFKQEFILG